MKEKTIKKILDSTPDLYDQIAVDFNQTRNKPWPILDLLKLHLNSAKNILDVGCGGGRLADLITHHQNYTGWDNSRELIKMAQNKYYNRKNINFQVKDIITDQLPTRSYDLVLLIAVLHHLPTSELRLRVLKNIYNALTDQSEIIITTWNLWQRDYRRHLFNYKIKFIDHKILSPSDAFIPWQKNSYRYVHSFNQRELKKLLASAGFKITEIFYEYQGQKTSIFRGRNLVAIASKK